MSDLTPADQILLAETRTDITVDRFVNATDPAERQRLAAQIRAEAAAAAQLKAR